KLVDVAVLDECGCQVDLRREFALQPEATSYEAWRLQLAGVGAERHGNGTLKQIAIAVKKEIRPLPGLWTHHQEQRGGIIKNAHPRRHFSVARTVQTICCSYSRGKQRATHNLIPIVA